MARDGDIIFSDAFRAGIKQSVVEAVTAADAKGLPPAYDPKFSLGARQDAVDFMRSSDAPAGQNVLPEAKKVSSS